MGKLIDITGQKFNRLTVLYRDVEYEKNHNLHKGAYWKCQCDCGEKTTVWGPYLRNGNTKSCGCLQKEKARINGGFKDLTGQKFNRLLVLKLNNNYKKENKTSRTGAYWNCLCDCGNEVTVLATDLICGQVKSCGCLRLEKLRESCMKDITGQVFGHLTALEIDKNYKQEKQINSRSIYWKCRCTCGNIVSVEGTHLRRNETRSCGCVQSRGEEKIAQLLKENNICFTSQKTYLTCKFPNTNAAARFDFYINNQFLLEFDGIQHFKPYGWSTKENYELIKSRDLYKNLWCKENNIPLKRIPYWCLEELTIEDIMGDNYLVKE